MTCISTSTGLLRRWLSPAIASLYWTARSAEPRSGSARPPDDCDGGMASRRWAHHCRDRPNRPQSGWPSGPRLVRSTQTPTTQCHHRHLAMLSVVFTARIGTGLVAASEHAAVAANSGRHYTRLRFWASRRYPICRKPCRVEHRCPHLDSRVTSWASPTSPPGWWPRPFVSAPYGAHLPQPNRQADNPPSWRFPFQSRDPEDIR